MPFPTNKTTINHFIQADDLAASASNLFTTTPRTPTCLYISYLTSLITLPDNTSLIPWHADCLCLQLSYTKLISRIVDKIV